MQHAFRRHRGCSRLEYLKQLRLADAHRDLQAGDPTRVDTAATITARRGFTRTWTFSANYRRIYGCSPGRTLHG